MAQDYAQYLAAQIFNDQRHITYRNLSRALKVHCNHAKQMLYDFHRKQNSKKTNSVYATYLLAGVKRAPELNRSNADHRDVDGDTIMPSSQTVPGSSMPPPGDEVEEEPVPVTTIMLVKETDLSLAEALFETISGIHIYSLQIGPVSDLEVLAECNRKLAVEYSNEDPLQVSKQYGTIQNPGVRRRTGRRPPQLAAAVSVVQPSAPPAAKATILEQQTMASTESKSEEDKVKSNKKPVTKPTTAKPQNSNFFKAFTKGASKTQTTESQESTSQPLPLQDDTPMPDFSEDEDEDTNIPETVVEAKTLPGKSRKERTDELKAMMEQEDDEAEDNAPTPADQDEGAIDHTIKEEEPKETATVQNGRRRGRRRVMKKRTVKDEEGYLVTKEEAAWESFSEDEPALKKPKVEAALQSKPAGGGKKISKPQGNIMSFFAKK